MILIKHKDKQSQPYLSEISTHANKDDHLISLRRNTYKSNSLYVESHHFTIENGERVRNTWRVRRNFKRERGEHDVVT